ncbi:MAG: cell division ATPase MinD [Candidatus Aenigmatarchaeota archaeon]
MARIIGIVSGKGGVGKTTLTINLGSALSQFFKKRVTLIDCNITTSHLGLYLGMYYCPITLNKVLRGESDIEEAIYDHFTGMKVVPASLSVSELEGVDVTLLRESIKPIEEKNDIILLDGSPGLGREAMACLKACDEVLYVTSPYVPSVIDIVKYQEVVNELNLKPIGIVLNAVDRARYEMNSKEIEELVRLPVLASIPYDKNIKKSLSLKMPVVVLNKNSPASKEIIKFAARLVGEEYKLDSSFSRIMERLRNFMKFRASLSPV